MHDAARKGYSWVAAAGYISQILISRQDVVCMCQNLRGGYLQSRRNAGQAHLAKV